MKVELTPDAAEWVNAALLTTTASGCSVERGRNSGKTTAASLSQQLCDLDALRR